MAHERTSRRPFGYRSFITCDDPRGVVECGTVRKPKVIHTQKGAPRKRLESDSTTEEARSPTSFHVLEVSRGAQKLNHVIKSWSSGHSKNNSKDIAQDLLKGALDLGESLAMLSRLQQSPNYLLESNKKQHRKKIERCSFDKDDDCLDMDEMQVMGSHQERRLSFEDMTTVIREGVCRKNVFLDEDCGDINTFYVPSTSSRQSSSIHSGNLASSESLILPATSLKKKNKKTKRSNLIAKLMGLEDVSLLPYDPRKGKGEKNLKQKKTAFDLDPPSERKHGHDPQKSGWKRKPTLDQTIEAVDYKGLPSAFNSELSNSKQKLSDVDSNDRPPIVILRPLRFSCLELEHPIEPKSRAQVYEEMLLGTRVRNNPLAQTDECEPLNCNEDFGKAVKSKSRSQKKQIVEKKAQDGDKVTILKPKTTRGGSNMKVSRYRDDYAEARSNHEKESVVQTSDSSRINEHASQTDITVADYVDDDQSSPSETSQVFGNPRNSETFMITNEYGGTDHVKLGQCSSVDSGPIQGSNACYKHELFGALTAPCIGKLKTLLLSNQPFIKHAEELFDLKVNPDSDLSIQTDNGIDHNELSARELLDTANELIGLHGSRACRPLASTAHKPSCIVHYCYSSLEQLVGEVCDEMEAFRWYRKEEGDDHSTDVILMLVKRDLRTTGLVGGVWDMGWTTLGLADEIAEITRGVDQLVLDGLIQEILVDLSL